MSLRLDGLEAHGDCSVDSKQTWSYAFPSLLSRKAEVVTHFMSTAIPGIERRAVFAGEEGSRKGSSYVLYSPDHLRRIPTSTATASYHKLSSQPREKC